MEIELEAFGITDVGKRRSENQDQFLIGKLEEGMTIQSGSVGAERVLRLPPASGTFLVVADGMGGHAGGRIASSVAVECFARYLRRKPGEFLTPGDHLSECLTSAVCFCHSTLREMCDKYPNLRGMGTTFTAAYVFGKTVYLVHAGDSRCYLIRQGWAEQLTTDHTLAQLYNEANPAEARAWREESEPPTRMNHVLWNCLGGAEKDLDIEVIKREIVHGDLLLLCSDGLTKYVSHESLVALVGKTTSLEAGCRELVVAANEAGGADNVTVVLAQCLDDSNRRGELQEHNESSWAIEDTAPFTFPTREREEHEMVPCESNPTCP